MNRLQFIEQIERRVPALAVDTKRWEEAEQLRKEFVRDFSRRKIPHLTLDQYVVGKGSHDSFCYRLEFKMDKLGRIKGKPSDKYGIFFKRESQKYASIAEYGPDINRGFQKLKRNLSKLIEAAETDDLNTIAESRITSLVRGKLLFLYAPNKFAPIYSRRHLKHFVAALNLRGNFETEWQMQRALMDFRAQFPLLTAQSPILYMWLLYDLFGPPDAPKSGDPGSNAVPLLNDAVRGAEIIGEMPPASQPQNAATRKAAKIDFEKRQRQLKRIGDRGEAIVVELERQRLTRAGKLKLAKNVNPVSQTDDTLGYDVLSFEEDGTERYIEVKATTGGNLDRGFYISANELEHARKLPNYYIYIVFSTMSANPMILRIKKPTFPGEIFHLTPVAYHVALA